MVQKSEFRAFFASMHRSILLDIVAFGFNLVLMLALTQLLANLALQAGKGNPSAKAMMALFCLGIVFLQPIGAILKRHHAHQRNNIPPRIFYLAENNNLKITGLAMFLANFPVLLRVLFGVS
jgi:hypothetical protein